MEHDVEKLMAVNSAITGLIAIEGDTQAHAEIVIKFGDTLECENILTLEMRLGSSGGGSTTGYASGFGNIDIEDEGETERHYEIGQKRERVGHYRLWKAKKGLICFHHFWASSVTTSAEPESEPPTYHLGYDLQSLEPLYLGLEARRYIFSLGWFHICEDYLKVTLGEITKTHLNYVLEISPSR